MDLRHYQYHLKMIPRTEQSQSPPPPRPSQPHPHSPSPKLTDTIFVAICNTEYYVIGVLSTIQ